MADLTLKELQAFNDSQRKIIEKQQVEIERLRQLILKTQHAAEGGVGR